MQLATRAADAEREARLTTQRAEAESKARELKVRRSYFVRN